MRGIAALRTSAILVAAAGALGLPAVPARAETMSQPGTFLSAPLAPGTIFGTVTHVSDEGPFLASSTDGGRTWTLRPADVDLTAVLGHGETILGLAADGSRQRSTDGGQTWVPAGSISGRDAIVPDPTRPASAWACSPVDSGPEPIMATTDGGVSWHRTPTPHHDCVQLAVQPGGRHVLLMIPDHAGGPRSFRFVYRSTNDGRSWARRRVPFRPFSYTFDPQRPRVVIATTSRGMWRSRDAGRHWTHLPIHVPDLGLPALVDGQIVFGGGRLVMGPALNAAGTRASYLVSTDDGTTWRRTHSVSASGRTGPRGLPFVYPAVSTGDSVLAPSAAGMWRLDRGSSRWKLAPLP